MNCKKCNKPIDYNYYQGYCEDCYKELLNIKDEQTSNLAEELQQENSTYRISSKETETEYEKNSIASLIKILSIIVLIIGIVGGIALINHNGIIGGIVSLILIILSFSILFGFGEIIQLLEDIKNK